MVERAVRLLFGLQVFFVFMLQPTAGFVNFSFFQALRDQLYSDSACFFTGPNVHGG